jgi:hypothetical protein
VDSSDLGRIGPIVFYRAVAKCLIYVVGATGIEPVTPTMSR